MEDFYFAYGYDKAKKTANRLYRFIGGLFEKLDKDTKEWKEAPEQCKIFIGEDWEYEEITENEANSLTVLW